MPRYKKWRDEIAKLNGTMAAAGSIDYYENIISGLEKMRDSSATSAAGVQRFNEKIAAYQEKVDKLENKRVTVTTVLETVENGTTKSPVQFSYGPNNDRIKELQKQRDAYTEVQQKFGENTDKFKEYAKIIEGLNFAINFNIDPASLIQAKTLVTATVDEMQLKQMQFAQTAAVVGDAVANAFDTMSNRFVESLGGAATGMEGFTKIILGTVLKLVSMRLAESLSAAIAGATEAGAATAAAAPVTTPAFIATAVAGVFAAFAAIPKFETGGVVGGSSYYGDKILTRLNSRELVLNTKQQEKIYKSMDNGGGGSASDLRVHGEVTVRGEDIQIALSRADKRKNRIG